ncbi:Cof-type HAD-IIB family hydrolase [Paenibacillus oleatilyticus]|uniref:Cof-type HAD-IIB family hydrolase n=1 Tax=Paenibacillus oleatilyticus TaxID=2594886 RepID=A0ABV4V0L8_9BACL
MYRLLALDMDGTLLNRSKVITPAVCNALQTAIREGVNVTIASGRFPASVWLHARHVGMNGRLVAFNGAVILDAETGERVHGFPIPPDAARRIAELAAEAGAYVHFYGYRTLFVEHMNEMNESWPLANVVIDPDKPLTYENYREQADLIQVKQVGPLAAFAEAASEPLYKATIISENPELLVRLYDELRSWNELALTKTGQRRFDINAAGISKRTALEALCRMYGMHAAEVAAIGDYDNDVDMLQWAGLGIAMANSSDCVKRAADTVTASNEEDGVAEAVRRYLLS